MSGYYAPPPRMEFDGLSRAETVARMLHEAYERRAFGEFGYRPRAWDDLHEPDQQIKIAAAQELVDRGMIELLPECPHTNTILRRLEARQCINCGTYPRLIPNFFPVVEELA